MDTPPGRYLLHWEQDRYDELVADVFGYHALQLGMPRLAGLRANRMPHRWLALGEAQAMILKTSLVADSLTDEYCEESPVPASLHAEPEMLPFPQDSLDLVLLPHVLEDCHDAHAALREVFRVLRPEGRLVVSGLNPYSLWGARHSWARVYRRLGVGGPSFLPPAREFITPGRMRDWLQLLGMEIDSISFGCYKPAVTSTGWLERYEFLDSRGPRWWPVLGAAYVIVATKRVQGMRLISPSWRAAPATAPAPAQVPAANRHNDAPS